MWRTARVPVRPLRPEDLAIIAVCFTAALALSVGVFLYGMRTGVKALEDM